MDLIEMFGTEPNPFPAFRYASFIQLRDNAGQNNRVGCESTLEVSGDVQNISRRCGSRVAYQETVESGTGKITMGQFMDFQTLHAIHAFMTKDTALRTGVRALQANTTKPHFAMGGNTVPNSDIDNMLLYYFPNVVVAGGWKMSVDNTATELTEQSLELSYAPDENGFGAYYAYKAEFEPDSEFATWDDYASAWMNEFSPALVAPVI